MPYTFAQLKAEISPLLWPQGEAENLVAAHNKFFIEALLEIQRWANCFQHNNTQLYRACSRYYKCGVNVMDGPSSESSRSIANSIQRLSVIDQLDPVTRRESASAPDEWCSQIFYEQVGYSKILKYQQQVESCSSCGGFANFTGIFGFNTGNFCKGNFPTPDDAEYLSSPALPMGHHYQPQASTNSPRGRANRGVWALERGRIYIAPWLQNTETVIVEWNGIKSEWEDLDIVDDNPQLKRAVRYYVAWNHAKDYDRDDVAAAAAEKSWRMALSQLMRDCREEGRVRSNGIDGISDGVGDSDGNGGGASGSGAHMADVLVDSGGGARRPAPATFQNQLVVDPGNDGCPDVATPMFDPPSGEIVTYPIFTVITSATAGAAIYYTTNGTTPTRASQLYTFPLEIESGTQVNAKAFLGECPSFENSTNYLDAVDFSKIAPVLSVLCTDTDRAGPWYVFHPDGSKDINWNVFFELNDGAVVKRLELYETDENGIWISGRCWATDYTIFPLGRGAFASYPLVIDHLGLQLETVYKTNLNQSFPGPNSWDLFGESVGVPVSGSHYKLIIFLTDGTSFYTTHSLTCDPPCVPEPVLITASNLVVDIVAPVGSETCPCYTFNLMDQVATQLGGMLVGFARLAELGGPPENFGGTGVGSGPGGSVVCLNNPGTYYYRGYAFRLPNCQTYADFSVTLTCDETTTTTPCDDGFGLTKAVDITVKIVSFRDVDYTDPGEPYCAQSVLVKCDPDPEDHTGTWQTINTYHITELTRENCSIDQFSSIGVTTNCQEMAAAGSPLEFYYDIPLGLYGFDVDFAIEDLVGPGVYDGPNYVDAGCGSGFTHGTFAQVTIV